MPSLLPHDPGLPERTRRRVALYLIPYLFFLYILAYLDRANVSVAMEGMNLPPSQGGVGFTAFICGFGTGLFFWGYWILEIPSTQGVLTYGARWVFIRILVLWGLSCTLIGFIGLPWFNDLFSWLPGVDRWPLLGSIFPHKAEVPEGADPSSVVQPDTQVVAQFYFLRFMLGLFEGGFFPAVIMYLSIWFRPRDRSRAIAAFMSAIPVSLLLGTPLSEFLMKEVEWGGLPGWRWVYIIQGVVPILAGVVTVWFLPDRPEKADWLPPDEKSWLVGELARDQAAKTGHGHGWGGQTGVVLLMTFYYFCMNVASYGLSTFMPTLIKTQSGLPKDWAGYVAGLPYLFGLAGMLFNGWHSDRTGERIWHTVFPLVGLSLGLSGAAAAVATGQGALAAVILTLVVGGCMYAHLPAFWPLPTVFMGAAGAAAAIGFINMIGNFGGFVGPVVFGRAAAVKAYATGLFILAPFPLASALIILLVGYLRREKLQAARESILNEAAPSMPRQGPSEGIRPADAGITGS
ncbi:MAG: MFS transporter [Gemmataceae bacterium]|nr:MFS transporter [Gemmataceae bacterium]